MKLSSNFIYLTFIIVVLFFSSCRKLHEDDNHHFKIYVENYFDKAVYVWYDIDWHWYDNPYEEHHRLFAEEPVYETECCHKILPKGIDSELLTHNGYYETFRDDDSIVITLLDAERPNDKDSECFLVRYHLSKSDLQEVNFHVCFPPTEAMKNFYMKPSYEDMLKLYKRASFKNIDSTRIIKYGEKQ